MKMELFNAFAHVKESIALSRRRRQESLIRSAPDKVRLLTSSPTLFLSLLALLFAALPARAQVSLVSTGSVWSYNDTGTDLNIDWYGVFYNDGAWATGSGEFGYGDGDEATVVSFGTDANNKYPTTYFRLHFNVANASSISNLQARIKRDDGAVVYLNGTEVFRDNMPTGQVYYTNFAAGTAADDGATFITHNFAAAGLLVTGSNVLAVEIHQANGTSSDLSFDMSLVGNPKPSIAITSPTNGQTIAASTVNISGTATPGGTNVNLIQVFTNGVQIGTATSSPFSVSWQGVPPGEYALQAIVTDSSGLKATSAVVNVEVQAPPATLLIPRNSTWKYYTKTIDLGPEWLALNYNDSEINGWTNGVAPLGDNVESAVQLCTTVIDIGPSGSRYQTVYFRKVVNVSQAAGYQGLILRVQRDDEVFIYLNGQFLTNSGCSGNTSGDSPTLPHSSYCCVGQTAVSGTEETQYWEYRVPSILLVDGPNIFAVEGRQQASGSSDLQFDLEVEGNIDTTAPVVIDQNPIAGQIVRSLDHIDVTFSESVQGINASDLLIDNEPATNITFISAREYVFSFPPPPTGTVQVTWAVNNGITDTSPLHNPFDGSSAGWTYTYNTNVSTTANVIISEFMANNNSGIL